MSDDRLLLVDSSPFAVLAAAGLVERVAERLGFQVGAIRRLDAIVPMVQKGKKFKEFSEEQKAKIIDTAKKIQSFTAAPGNVETREQLNRVRGIDIGEATLFAALAERPMHWLSTGDNVALRALCAAPELREVRDAVASRIVCLEAIVYLLCQDGGYDEAATALKPFQHHKTLKCFFPVDRPPPGSEMVGPTSYLRSLCAELGRGFLHCPPCPDSVRGECRIAVTPP